MSFDVHAFRRDVLQLVDDMATDRVHDLTEWLCMWFDDHWDSAEHFVRNGIVSELEYQVLVRFTETLRALFPDDTLDVEKLMGTPIWQDAVRAAQLAQSELRGPSSGKGDHEQIPASPALQPGGARVQAMPPNARLRLSFLYFSAGCGWFSFVFLLALARSGAKSVSLFLLWGLLMGVLGTYHFVRARQLALRWRRYQTGLCVHCGYDLRATPDRCPECGAAPVKFE